MTRTAISPLFATKSFLKRGASVVVVENVAQGVAAATPREWEFQQAVVGKRPAFAPAKTPWKYSRLWKVAVALSELASLR